MSTMSGDAGAGNIPGDDLPSGMAFPDADLSDADADDLGGDDTAGEGPE